MRKHSRIKSFWLVLATAALLSSMLSAGTLYFDKAEYAARRAKFMEKIPDGVAVILGAQLPTSYHHYYQNNDFLYLSGVEIPNAVLVIDGVNKKTLLLFTADERSLRNEGLSTDILKDPAGVTGVDSVLPIEELTNFLARLPGQTKIIYTPFKPEELMRECSLEKFRTLQRQMILNPWDGRQTREGQFVNLLRQKFPAVEVRDCSPQIWELRMIKTPAEIALLRKAARIGVKAHTEIMKACRAGMYEYELSAVINYVFEKEGAQESAYGVIISSGENHPYLHYAKHDRLLNDGDFLVVDAGPDLDFYDIDITTSFPANGRFTPRQKEVYEAALAVHENSMKVYRPGLTEEQCRQGGRPERREVRPPGPVALDGLDRHGRSGIYQGALGG